MLAQIVCGSVLLFFWFFALRCVCAQANVCMYEWEGRRQQSRYSHFRQREWQGVMRVRLWMLCSLLSSVNAYINNNTHTQKTHIIHSLECVTKLFIIINCLFCACPLPLGLWVCVWESAHYPSHRSGALRLLIAHTNRLVIHVLPFMALFPVARGECLSPQVGSVNLASPVPRGRNRKLIRAPGCAVILLWKVFQAASQYWFFWAGGKWRRPHQKHWSWGRGGDR